jgi:hypothetical protein
VFAKFDVVFIGWLVAGGRFLCLEFSHVDNPIVRLSLLTLVFGSTMLLSHVMAMKL